MPIDLTTPASTPAPDPKKAKRSHSVQNQAIAAYITDSLKTLNAALENTEAVAKLATRGYSAAAIQEGVTLHDAALKAFNEQLPGIGAGRTQTEKRQDQIKEAREDYTAYRGIARSSFPGQGDRVALGLTGDIPDDFGKFVTAAETSYAAGQKAPFTAKLTVRGYSVAVLAAHSADLKKLTEPDLGEEAPEPEPESTAAAAPTPEPTPAPEPADDLSDYQAVLSTYEALKKWMKEFKGIARIELRKRPDLLRALGL